MKTAPQGCPPTQVRATQNRSSQQKKRPKTSINKTRRLRTPSCNIDFSGSYCAKRAAVAAAAATAQAIPMVEAVPPTPPPLVRRPVAALVPSFALSTSATDFFSRTKRYKPPSWRGGDTTRGHAGHEERTSSARADANEAAQSTSFVRGGVRVRDGGREGQGKAAAFASRMNACAEATRGGVTSKWLRFTKEHTRVLPPQHCPRV